MTYRCATGEAWPSIMLSCVPPKPCEPRSIVNYTLTHDQLAYQAQHVISASYNPTVIDTNGASVVNLREDNSPRVLASSGKLTGAQSDQTVVMSKLDNIGM